MNKIRRGPASLENHFSKTICHLPAISFRSEGKALCIWRCDLCINDKRMLKHFIVETPGAAIDTRHGKRSATERKRATSIDIIAQKVVITKTKTVVFEICETVPRKGRFWETNLYSVPA